MRTCQHCGATLAYLQTWPGGTMRWVDTGAQVAGAFCQARDGREHVPGEPPAPPVEDRHYVIGLPVAFTIRADGAVTIDVDLSEVRDIDEDHQACEQYGDEVVDQDCDIVSAAAARLAHTLTFTINPTTAQEAS